MITANGLSGDLFDIVIALLIITFVYFKWSFQYWKKKNLPYLEPKIPFGNVAESILGKKNLGITTKEIYDKMKANGWKHGGIYFFTTPVYFPVNLDLLKNIMSKDFQYFTDRAIYYNEKEDPLEGHLFNLEGEKWKNMRAKLSQTFTFGKMKMMFQTVAECRNALLKKMDQECSKEKPIDIKNILERFTTEVIGSCAFGLECKTFEEETSPFTVYCRKVFFLSKLQQLSKMFATTFPNLGKFLNLHITPKYVTNFFLNVVKDAIDYRETNHFVRNDFIQLLMEVQKTDNLTIEEVTAQCFLFFLGGFETSSNLMTFALYKLAKQPNIQQKVRNEIESVLAKHGGKTTYDAIQELTYMQMVIDETSRMYPPFPMENRKCVKDYKIPGEGINIKKGTWVIIPILAIHHDEEYYPHSKKFDPERFTEENKKYRHDYAHIPFGGGPRRCPAKRFAMMQVKIGLSALIGNYKFTVSEKTVEPFEMEPNTNVLSVVGDIWLNVQKL